MSSPRRQYCRHADRRTKADASITEYNTTANKESLATNNGANGELITAGGNKAPPLSAPISINRTATTARNNHNIYDQRAFNGSATKGGTASRQIDFQNHASSASGSIPQQK